MSIAKLKKALKEENLSLGERETLKKLKQGKISVVFMASNCKPSVRESVNEYAKHAKFETIELNIDAAEVGTICKKQFPIGILSY